MLHLEDNALTANTTGTRNIAIGSKAYFSSDTENDNIAIGLENFLGENSKYYDW